MAFSNANFDSKLSATINLWLSANYENLFIRNNALFVKMRENGSIKVGGLKMVEPVMFPSTGGPAAAGVSDGYAAVTQSAMTGFTAAEFVPAEYLIPISVEEYDLDQQTSGSEKIDWAQAIMQNGIERMMVAIETGLWAREQTANSNGSDRSTIGSILTYLNGGTSATTTDSQQPAELPEQLGARGVVGTASTTAVTTVGNISRITSGGGRWCTPINNTQMATSAHAFSQLLSMTVNGGRQADIIYVHRDIYDRLQNLASFGGANGGQFQQGSKLAELGFSALKFRNADVVTDDRVPTASFTSGTATALGYTALAINSKYLTLRAKSMKPQVRPVDDARALKVWTGRWLGQLTSSHLGRVHGRLTNLTNS